MGGATRDLRCQCAITQRRDFDLAVTLLAQADPLLREAALERLAALRAGDHAEAWATAWPPVPGDWLVETRSRRLVRAVRAACSDPDPRPRAMARWIVDSGRTVETADVPDQPAPTSTLSMRHREALVRGLSRVAPLPGWRDLLAGLLDDPACRIRADAATGLASAATGGHAEYRTAPSGPLCPTPAELDLVRRLRAAEPCDRARSSQDAFIATFGTGADQDRAVRALLASADPQVRASALMSQLPWVVTTLVDDPDPAVRRRTTSAWLWEWPPEAAPEGTADAVYDAFEQLWREAFDVRPRRSQDDRWSYYEERAAGISVAALDALRNVMSADSSGGRLRALTRFRSALDMESSDVDIAAGVTTLLLGDVADQPDLDDVVEDWLRWFRSMPDGFQSSMAGWSLVTTAREHASLSHEPPAYWPPDRWAGWWAATDSVLMDRGLRSGAYSRYQDVEKVLRDPWWWIRATRLATRAQQLLADERRTGLTAEQVARMRRVSAFGPGGPLCLDEHGRLQRF